MSLVVTTLKNDLVAAFALADWTACGNAMATAFDSFIKTGTVNTTETGTVTPPSGPTYVAYGVGVGSISTTGLSTLKSAIVANLMNPATLWAQVGPTIAGAINTDVITATVSTTISGGLTGAGAGAPGCINTAPTLSAFTTTLTTAFSLPAATGAWAAVADMVATAMDVFLKGAIVTTGPTDGGTTPPASWVGTGTGSIA